MSGPLPGPEKTRPTQLGVFDKPGQRTLTGIEIAALALSLAWLAGAAGFFMLAPGWQQDGVQGSRFLTVMLTIFMPVAMIWVAATAARASRVMREESRRLQTAIDAIRQTQIAQAQRGTAGAEPSVSRKHDEIAKATKKTETALATFHTSRREMPRPAPACARARRTRAPGSSGMIWSRAA